jgi:hypothetical protein
MGCRQNNGLHWSLTNLVADTLNTEVPSNPHLICSTVVKLSECEADHFPPFFPRLRILEAYFRTRIHYRDVVLK